MLPEIVLIGVDYRRAALDAREELSFTPEQALEILLDLKSATNEQEILLLSTCNRTEFYLAYRDDSPVSPVVVTLRRFRGHARILREDCMPFVETGDRAVEHLFRVAAGIESQILGDTHIVAQIKQAHRLAMQAGTLGPLLDRMVTESLRAAKRARRETHIGKGAASVGAAVLRSVRQVFGNIEHIRILILGAGEAGRDIASHLCKVAPASLVFAARSPDQAEMMAHEFKGRTADWENVSSELNSVDVVIAATAARLAILSSDSVRHFTAAREKQLLIIDAGVPRNADPSVAELPNVRLLNLDSLCREQEEALAARRLEIPRVEAILSIEMKRWRRWWEARLTGEYGAPPGSLGPLADVLGKPAPAVAVSEY